MSSSKVLWEMAGNPAAGPDGEVWVVAPAFDVPGVGRMAVLADPQGGMFNLMAG